MITLLLLNRFGYLHTNTHLLFISIYVPQSLLCKRTLWSKLFLFIRKWNNMVLVIRYFNEAREVTERFGFVFNQRQVDFLMSLLWMWIWVANILLSL